MKSAWMECTKCKTPAPEMKESAVGTCRLCAVLHCDECLNEAGYCTSCSEKMDYSMDEAIPV